MNLNKNPRLFAILILAIFYISLMSNKGFTERYIDPKNFYLYFLIFPLLGIVLYSGIKAKVKQAFNLSAIDIAVILYFIYLFIRILFTSTIPLYNTEFINQTLLIFFYFTVKYTYTEYTDDLFNKHYQTFYKGILILISLNAIYGIFQYFSIMPPSNILFKLGGSFGNPGPYSNFLILLTPFAYSILINKKTHSRFIYFLAVVSLLLTLIVLPLTQARTAWICFSISSFLYVLILLFKSKKIKEILKTIYLKITIFVAILTIVFTCSSYLFNYKKDSASGRLFIWEVTLQMIKDKPLFGHGFDCYIVEHNNYQAKYFKNHPNDIKNAYLSDSTTYAFNEYLQITSDLGLIGLIFFLCILFVALFQNFPKPISSQEKYNIFLVAKTILICFIVCSLFSYPLRSLPSLAILYFALASISGFTAKNSFYTITLEKKQCKSLSYIFTILLLLFYFNQLKRFQAEKDWFTTLHMKKQVGMEETCKRYSNLYETMKYNKYFLFNNGAELIVMKKYKEGIEKLNEALPNLNDVDIYIYLGRGYEETDNLTKAEECYKQAMYIVPSKLYPKYRLVKLYLKLNKKEEAINMATKLVQLKEKVETDISKSIKYEMENFLSAKTQKDSIKY